MSSCLGVRIGVAAMLGYSLGALGGDATVAWVIAIAAGTAVFLWSRRRARRTGEACGAGCTTSPLGPATSSSVADAGEPHDPAAVGVRHGSSMFGSGSSS